MVAQTLEATADDDDKLINLRSELLFGQSVDAMGWKTDRLSNKFYNGAAEEWGRSSKLLG